MTIKSRIEKLETQRGKAVEFVIVYIDGGVVTKEHNSDKHPELIGMTEADIDTLYSGRDDVQVIKIVYASQAELTIANRELERTSRELQALKQP